ncbi:MULTISPECIES: phage distal tail protein [unclassified Streptomyces]|uniref:phage distal tail protein n=1 Tax=unclassified Streptomyces TaxID=2593676 RepID=UPI002E0E34D2|nr:phage tail family protein [Streptomyces sp. NBC_01197]WSS49026.1 phage tail family protein [Streptomyces sp. NBC_01180]
MATITKDGQYDFAGVLLGPGTPYVVSEVTGLGAPELRTQDVDLATDDGAFPGVDYFKPREVTLEVGIRTPDDPSAAVDDLAVLNAAIAMPSIRRDAGDLAVLRVRWPGRGGIRRLYGRARRLETATMSQAKFGWIPLTLSFTATDPVWHDEPEQQLSLPLSIASTTLGFKAPLKAPITTGVVDPQLRSGWVANAGDSPAWPTLTIKGPVSNPVIHLAGSTRRDIELNLTVRTGEVLQIETRPGTRWVLLDGANASNALTRSSRLDLFRIPPGACEISWSASDYTNASRLTVAWRDAYTAL